MYWFARAIIPDQLSVESQIGSRIRTNSHTSQAARARTFPTTQKHLAKPANTATIIFRCPHTQTTPSHHDDIRILWVSEWVHPNTNPSIITKVQLKEVRLASNPENIFASPWHRWLRAFLHHEILACRGNQSQIWSAWRHPGYVNCLLPHLPSGEVKPESWHWHRTLTPEVGWGRELLKLGSSVPLRPWKLADGWKCVCFVLREGSEVGKQAGSEKVEGRKPVVVWCYDGGLQVRGKSTNYYSYSIAYLPACEREWVWWCDGKRWTTITTAPLMAMAMAMATLTCSWTTSVPCCSWSLSCF